MRTARRETEMVEVDVEYVRQTEMAVLFKTEDENEVWIPKSQIKDKAKTPHGTFCITIPEWLANKNGMI